MSWDVSMTKMIKDCDKNDNVDININIAIQIRFQEILRNKHYRRHTGPMVDTKTQIIPTTKWRREAGRMKTQRGDGRRFMAVVVLAVLGELPW